MNKIKQWIYEHRFVFMLIGILLAYGIVGSMDYHDERMMECAKKNLAYDSDKDVCK